MRLLIYTDVHWSSYSSIVRSRGEKYSTRLENLIKSVNWAEELARKEKVDIVVCLGDFFDAAQLNSEEVTALNEIKWCDLPHYFLVGNHEMGRNDLSLSTSHLFGIHDNFHVVDEPKVMAINDFNEFLFLPYMLNSADYPYVKDYTPGKSQIILSHNDIKGIQMGKFMSTSGIDLEGIKHNCRLFINGHLHNGEQIGNLINLGNLTGQNFSEDATKYTHNAMILDTSEETFTFVENPFALNFYKIDETNNFVNHKFKDNAVVSCTTSIDNIDKCKELLADVIESRLSIDYSTKSEEQLEHFEKVDNLKQFEEYVLKMIGSDDIIKEELTEVCK